MRMLKGSSILLFIVIILTIITLTNSYSIYAKTGEAVILMNSKESIVKVEYENLSSMALIDEGAFVMKEPGVVDDDISYSILLKNVNSYGQFQFSLMNDGNTDIKIVDINIDGLGIYEDYVSVEVFNINVGDVVKADSILDDIKVKTQYANELLDENFITQNINLEDIRINIAYEAIE